jgi:two-component system, OmpR family, response regulator
MRILIVEDEAEICEFVLSQLAVAGFDCDCVASVQQALVALVGQRYDLMLLDRRLPDGDGVSAIPKFRLLQPALRILVVTASDTLQSKVLGLDSGADDYLTKPFAPEELLARVRARLREFRNEELPPVKVGALSYNPATNQISVSGRPLILHRREFALLEALVRHVNQVAPRKSVMLEIYGEDEAVSPGALDTLVSRLRKRLEEAQAGVSIHLVRGRGYLLTEAA